VISLSGIIDLFAGMVEVVANNPASILIVLGFFGILFSVFLPIGIGVQLLIGGLGFFMLIVGIVVHVAWLQS
jgi:hypothetical protein